MPVDEAMKHRRQLVGVAYRLLGSITEAEDVTQEAYARWYAMSPQQRHAIGSPGAWLTTVASRLCLDVLGSARARRERYVGEWIPEPLPAYSLDHQTDPADQVTLDESISMAFLVVLEHLTPAERVAFILHDVFRYPFTEVASIVGRTPAACRQLATSARRRIRASRQASTPIAQQREIVAVFKSAWEAKDIPRLLTLLDPNATMSADGGGIVPATLEPVEGLNQIALSFAALADRAPDLVVRERTVNGQPGLVAEQDGSVAVVLAFEIAGGRILRIWAMRNPQKLRAWADSERGPTPNSR
ncbi:MULTISPECIES: RNA polymerase sigma factor SigJ [unclassified Microbacterium]|uniref:RNA polymerase sigma factor SigJ n=1 Tax=unclassified Microbacterium TaxID=2609290 RepID=UPI00214CADD3|nr:MULTISPECIES: RNA polymerase sigma factor SigJ [unclassified Microbacterium]MCR2810770.1 RNA polymerase sigma factor SigJ [Microbacterium sp. zg.B185]WIM18302.1 RNA polymerase sigma factor SigJ [Microbacterium sp. zg-B185]